MLRRHARFPAAAIKNMNLHLGGKTFFPSDPSSFCYGKKRLSTLLVTEAIDLGASVRSLRGSNEKKGSRARLEEREQASMKPARKDEVGGISMPATLCDVTNTLS